MIDLLKLDDINLSISGKPILSDVSFSIKSDEIVTIVGPNGAGKSTLLSIALGLKKPSSGSVVLRNKLNIGYVPQLVNRDPIMPVNVMEFLRLAKSAPSKKLVQDLLSELNLQDLSHSLISHLSGGELRRVLFVRALINSPDLLVLDEPTAGVDIKGQEQFYRQLNTLRKRYQFAILMVSHDLHLVMSTTDRVICLNQHICCEGKPAHVLHNPSYKALFCKQSLDSESKIAFYEHHHDHEH